MGRLKNLWELSKYAPKETQEGITLTSESQNKPKGQAKIVEMETPADLFPNQEEI